MKTKTLFNLLAVSFLVLALGTARQAQAQAPGTQDDIVPLGVSLGTGFTYQGRLTDTSGNPIAGPCNLRFTLYQSATGNDPVGAPLTANGVTTDNGAFSVNLDFGATAFTGDGRFLKIEVDCGSGYTALSPRVNLTPAPYALHAVSTGALHGRQVSDNAPATGNVLAWDGNSWMPTASSPGNAWSLTGNSGTTAGTNFVGTSDNVALEFKVNGARALRLEPNATSPNFIGGYSGNSVSAGVVGATIGGGGLNAFLNLVTADYATISGGRSNSVSGDASTVGGGDGNAASGVYSYIGGGKDNIASGTGVYATIGGGDSNSVNGGQATIGGGYGNAANGGQATIGGGYGNAASGDASTVGGGNGNAASGGVSTIGGGYFNAASGEYATVPGGTRANASLYGQMAYASGYFGDSGDAQSSLYVMRTTTTSASAWEGLYLDGNSLRLTIAPNRTLTFDILVVGRSNFGESAGYYCWGVVENVGGVTTVLGGGGPCMTLNEDDVAWDAQVIADDTNDALAMQVMGNGEIIRWVATVRTAEVAWLY